MPRRNRVTPFSELVSTPARGTLMGNRGCLHNRLGEIRRLYLGKRWILCLLDFKNRRRSPMTPGQYTELSFLDEATGLAAGHRPCAECQRERFDLFRMAWARANPVLAGAERPAATVIDDILHQERLSTGGKQRSHPAEIGSLPDGSLVSCDGDPGAFLVRQGELLRWSPFGYAHAIRRPASVMVRVLTPPSVVRTLTTGFRAGIHPSAATGLE
ncbi:MAG TPA: hypothetical protein VLT62_06565 [Candidatus Methylomirabilis sp.]|nr:hypothetical protein [Candidatus Methylomirabilis sp.]